MKEIISKSQKETIKIGRQFGRRLKGGETILLKGELGSGKTTFAQGIAKGLGIKENVNSPSYVLLKRYQIPDSDLTLNHFDFYRQKQKDDLPPADLTDYLGEENQINLIEWPERVSKYLTNLKKVKEIKFENIANNKRRIKL